MDKNIDIALMFLLLLGSVYHKNEEAHLKGRVCMGKESGETPVGHLDLPSVKGPWSQQ